MRLRPYPCPVCGATHTQGRLDTGDAGQIYESEVECRACGLYYHDYAYGNIQERTGWFWLTGSWTDPPEQIEERIELARKALIEIRAARDALAEIRAAYRHPEFAGVRKAPRGVLAEWMAEHGFPMQAAALMNCDPKILYLPVSP